jgi:hypothetical protein
MAKQNTWLEALRLHEDAAAGFAHAAEAIPPELWTSPVAEGKWTPAQITDHLNRAYQTLLHELGGGAGMALRTRGWQRLILRFTLVPRLLAGAPFPRGARSPRELRPAEAAGLDEQPLLIARFRELAERFQTEVQEAHATRPRQRLTHAYFGAAPLERSVVFCARHILHHHKQLPTISAAEPGAR